MHLLSRIYCVCRVSFVAGVLGILVAGMSGCAGTDATTAGQGGDGSENTAAVASDESAVTVPLAPAAPDVKTIQLYRTGDETSLPVIGLQSGGTLTLEFDILGSEQQPVSVFFYHANRSWQYDLQPAQYMGSFASDDIFSYTPSRGTDVSYTHYSYRFPNNDIEFVISGNYVIRVTEQGNEDAVLFEQTFFVSEESAELQLDLRRQIGQRDAFAQPVARLYPPQLLQNHPFDVHVCFMRGGRASQIRCVASPTLIQASFYQFQLPMDEAFEKQPTTRVLDLSLLQESNEIANINFQAAPYTVTLGRDYARFGGSLRNVTMFGQSLISSTVRNLSNPDVEAQYVRAIFRYVPVEEEPIDGSLVVMGSFNDWQYESKHRMSWNAEQGYYVGEALVKQGVHEYQYRSTGEPTYTPVGSSRTAMYTGLVYYYDPTLQTDRLLAVNSIYSR